MCKRMLISAMVTAILLTVILADTSSAQSDECAGLPDHAELQDALRAVVTESDSGGLGNHMWATIVNRDGAVCAITFSGQHRGDQYPGSRVISAQKATTANAFSLPGLALATGNLYTAVQPGNSFIGLQESVPVDTAVAYGGDARRFGQPNDPMVSKRIGGINVFGGGLPLYDPRGVPIGGLGVGGDTSCTDHIVAWKLRKGLDLDYVPDGVSATGDDNITYDQSSEWAHPFCGQGEVPITDDLPINYPTGEPKAVSEIDLIIPEDFVEYSSDAVGIKLQVPDSWIVTEEGPDDGILLESEEGCIDVIEGGEGECSIVLIVTGLAEEMVELQGVESGNPAAVVEAAVRDLLEEAEILEGPDHRTINDQDAATAQFLFEEDGTSFSGSITAILTDERVALVVGATTSDLEADLLPIYEPLVSTVVLTAPEVTEEEEAGIELKPTPIPQQTPTPTPAP